jgi:hypothetical protein
MERLLPWLALPHGWGPKLHSDLPIRQLIEHGCLANEAIARLAQPLQAN